MSKGTNSLLSKHLFRELEVETQLNEVVDNWPTKYELQDISGAFVLGYFYRSYSEFVDWLEDTLSAIEKYGYTTIFTGHSLGGALTVHAAIDILL